MGKKGNKLVLPESFQKRRQSILKSYSPQNIESSKELAREGTPRPSSRKKKPLVPREKLWNKLSEVVDKRRVRFSKFVSVANEANKLKITSSSPKDGKAKTRRLSVLAKPKKDFSVKGSEDFEPPNKQPKIIIEAPEPAALEVPGKKEDMLQSPISLRSIGSGMMRTRKNMLDRFKSTSSKTWMIRAFEDIKRGSRSSQNVRAGSDLEVRRGSDSLVQQGQQIFEIIDTINTQKKKRLKSDIEEEMVNIHNRVKDALIAVDMYDEEEDLMKEAKGRFPPLSSLELMKQRRERMYREKAVSEEVEKFKGICKERAAVTAEVNQWLANKNLLDVLEDEGDIQKAGRYFQEVHGTIMTILHRYTEHSDKVLDLGNSLLTAAGAIIRENEENAKRLKEKQKEKIVVYDERQILADSVKWENAVKMVLNTFEDAMKWTKNNTYKYIYQKGQKQLKEINYATKKKLQELKEKTKQAADTKAKLNAAKTEMESKHKEVEDMKKTVRTIMAEMEEKKHLLEKSEEKNKGLQTKVMEAEAKIRAVKDEMKKKAEEISKLRKSSRPSTPPPQPRTPTPPPPQIIKVIDSSTQLKLEETEKNLEEAQNRLSEKKDEIRQLERQLRIERERVKQLRLEVEEAEKLAAEAELTITMPAPTNTPAEPVIPDNLGRDSEYYKTLLSGMKRDFNAELEKLKSHLNKERSRNAAAVKKVENNHKEQIQGIQKDVVRVLRAIMHFRDHIMSILEKENLKDPAAALKDLGTLVPDKLAPDPRELLVMLVGNVVEFLHNMESIMANAFLTMRMIIKGTITINAQNQIVAKKSETKVQQVEEVKKSIKNVKEAKNETANLARRLRKAKEKLNKLEELSDKHEMQDKKYRALLQRYRAVWKMYSHLQKDMDVLQTDFQDAMEAKIKEREDLLVSQIRMELKDRKVVNEQQLRMTLEEQRQNLKTLEKAYDENKISKDLYSLASSLLQRSIEIPKKRLRYMMEQYIAFKTVKETKERVGEILGEEQLPRSVQRDMERYVRQIDEKLNSNMKVWHNRMKSLEDEKRQLLMVIWRTFNDVFAESGILLVHPLLNQSAADKSEIYTKIASTVTKETLEKMIHKKKRISSLMEMPSALVGKAAPTALLMDSDSVWNGQFSSGDSYTALRPKVYTPHVVNYDVNREKIRAYGALGNIVREPRSTFPLSLSSNYSIINDTRLVF